jgi:hypothetical protein
MERRDCRSNRLPRCLHARLCPRVRRESAGSASGCDFTFCLVRGRSSESSCKASAKRHDPAHHGQNWSLQPCLRQVAHSLADAGLQNALAFSTPSADQSDGQVHGIAASLQLLTPIGNGSTGHQEHDGRAGPVGGNRKISSTIRRIGSPMSGGDDERVGQAAMGQRDARSRANGCRAGNTRNDLERNIAFRKNQRLFSHSPEDTRIAALKRTTW